MSSGASFVLYGFTALSKCLRDIYELVFQFPVVRLYSRPYPGRSALQPLFTIGPYLFQRYVLFAPLYAAAGAGLIQKRFAEIIPDRYIVQVSAHSTDLILHSPVIVWKVEALQNRMEAVADEANSTNSRDEGLVRVEPVNTFKTLENRLFLT